MPKKLQCENKGDGAPRAAILRRVKEVPGPIEVAGKQY
jgi:hypothetical protein